MREGVERLPDYIEAASIIGRDALRAALDVARERDLDPAKLIRVLATVISVVDEPELEGWLEGPEADASPP